MSISSTKWGVLPLPAVANGAPPCFFEYSIRSLRLFTGSDGDATMTDGLTAISPTGTRSSGAYGIFVRIRLLVTVPTAPTRKV
ncbi:hypothetical protein D3C81_1266540 [compost metagenome]